MDIPSSSVTEYECPQSPRSVSKKIFLSEVIFKEDHDHHHHHQNKKPKIFPTLATTTTSTTVEVIEPGLVVLKNFISDSRCQELATMAQEWGEQGEDGFYTTTQSSTTTTNEGKETRTSTTTKVLNTGDDTGRGRIYDKATRFPTSVVDHCKEAVKMAMDVDSVMPNMTCTHLLLNMYTSSSGLCWHRDIYENDGTSNHPVVNLCVGASCKFGLKHSDDDPDRIITLRSGDVLLFGGPCRLIKHAVLEVDLEDCPYWMKTNPVRYSFTFRDSPEVLGREDEFKYFKVNEHLVGQDKFEVPKDESVTGLLLLPSQESQASIVDTVV